MTSRVNLLNPQYQKRVLSAYLHRKESNLDFWHTELGLNEIDLKNGIGRYYMDFRPKTVYKGPFDSKGIPMLNYRGDIGLQYNPNAVAQFALGLYDLFLDSGDTQWLNKFIRVSDWFVENLRMIDEEVGLWEYCFDFEYYHYLKAPWRSALAQGQGISVMVRAYNLTGERVYLNTAERAYASFMRDISQEGGVTFTDNNGDVWLEECVISPPTHVLNGYIWSLWGVLDYYLTTRSLHAEELYSKCVITLERNISRYHLGFWSRYHLAPTLLPMIASPYYHRLHIVQLRAMERLTGRETFKVYADIWEHCAARKFYKNAALAWKSLFKLIYF